MSRWTRDSAFRTYYTISVQESLTDRDLSNDGRMQDQDSWEIIW